MDAVNEECVWAWYRNVGANVRERRAALSMDPAIVAHYQVCDGAFALRTDLLKRVDEPIEYVTPDNCVGFVVVRAICAKCEEVLIGEVHIDRRCPRCSPTHDIEIPKPMLQALLEANPQ